MNAQEITRTISISDQEVVRRILNGEKDFYEILVERCNRALYRVIRGYIKEDNIAEDIMQNTYIIAYQKLDQYKGKSTFSTWLIRIGINETLRYIRQTKKKGMVFSGEFINERPPFQDKIHPELKMIHLESRLYIEKAIDELPAKLRTVFIMLEIEDLKIEEVSKCLQITNVNVKVRLYRAKRILQKKLLHLSDLEGLYPYGSEHCDEMVSSVMNTILEMDSALLDERSTNELISESKFSSKILHLSVISFLGFSLINCSPSSNDNAETSMNVDGMHMHMNHTEELNAELDADFPIFQPSERTFTNYLDFGKSENVYIRQNTSIDNRSKLIAFYKENLPKNGWIINSMNSTDDKIAIKKNGRYATIRLFNIKEADTIALAYSINLVRPKLALQNSENKDMEHDMDGMMQHDK